MVVAGFVLCILLILLSAVPLPSASSVPGKRHKL